MKELISSSYMLNFEIKPTIVIGFSLYWSWVWVVFWSSLFYSQIPPQDIFGIAALDSLGSLWALSLLCMSATLLLLFQASTKHSPLGMRMSCLVLAAAPTAFGTMLIALPQFILTPESIPFICAAGAAILGFGSAFELVLWGELLTLLGARQSIVYFVASTILSVFELIVMLIIDPTIARLVASAFPIVGMMLFSRERSLLTIDQQLQKKNTEAILPTKEAPLTSLQSEAAVKKSLAELLGISLFFGISYGIMKGLFIFEGSGVIFIRDQLNALALFAGSMAIFLTMGVFHMNFRRLTYQVALPLMAAGFVLIPLSTPANLIGFSLHQLGYQYFYTIIWGMWPVLAHACNAPRARFVCIGLFGVQFGQLFGSVIGSSIMNSSIDDQTLCFISSFCVFVILLVALFAFGNPTSDDTWIMLRPFERQPKQANEPSKFDQSVSKLSTSRGLSPRETEVFKLLAQGKKKQFISKALCISENTAKTHIRNVYQKLGVHSQEAMMDMIELDAR